MLALFDGRLDRIGRHGDGGEGNLAAARNSAWSTYSSGERDLQGAGSHGCGVWLIDGRAKGRQVVEISLEILEIEGEVKNVCVRIGCGCGPVSYTHLAAGYLTAAAGILAVEAYHAGYIRTSLTGRAIAAGSESAYPYLGAANLVEDLRATLTVGNSAAPSTTGSVETLLTLPTSLTMPSSIVAASAANAVGFARTVNQVLHIVYGSPTVGAKSGGFFPNGVNSVFATTTA